MKHHLTQFDTEDPSLAFVLRGLAQAEPPAGMEQRVLAAMQNEQANTAPSSFWRAWPRITRYAACCVAAIALVCILLAHRTQVQSNARVAQRTTAQHLTAGAPSSQVASSTTALLAASSQLRSSTHSPASRRDQASLGPIIEPGMTHQESLMRRMAQHHDPDVLAMLQPRERWQPAESMTVLDTGETVVLTDSQ